jgi:hypothetical protein
MMRLLVKQKMGIDREDSSKLCIEGAFEKLPTSYPLTITYEYLYIQPLTALTKNG